MKLTYDKEADAMYIALEDIKPRMVKQTVALNDDIMVDFNASKKIIGIEILSVSKNLPSKELKEVAKIRA
ncbi:MAG: DUF2283 domain-containing protein [archaeon]